MRLIGEAQQQWAPLRRKYNLSLFRHTATSEVNLSTRRTQPTHHAHSGSKQIELSQKGVEGQFSQFAYVDEPFLSWDFSLLSADSHLIGSVNRNFAGFGREIFTDTGVYALRMDAAGLAEEPEHLISKTGEQNEITPKAPAVGMTLDQRAVMLATAVSIDFDYFSRKSSSSGFMPFWFPFGVGGAAGEAGSEVADAEATGQSQDSGSPGAGSGQSQQNQNEEVWGENSNPWSEGQGGSGGSGGGGGEEGGGGDGWDIF